MVKPSAILSMGNTKAFIKIVITLSALLLMIFIWRVGHAYYVMQTAFEKMYEGDIRIDDSSEGMTMGKIKDFGPKPINAAVYTDSKTNKIGGKSFSVLLLGIDERDEDRGRTDTILVVTVNERLESIQILSIPRDTRVEIVGKQTKEKINHAYAHGGIPMTIATVEQLLSISIDYYVAVNMEGFVEVVDVLGGLQVENGEALSVGNLYFEKGDLLLNGEEALVYSRSRYEDPQGDFGRQHRQRQLVKAMIDKTVTMKTLLHFDDLIAVMGNRVKMNFKLTDLIRLQKVYRKASNTINQIQFKHGQGKVIDQLWYYILDPEELRSISERLQHHLKN